MRNGHLLIAKEKKPSFLIEYGPAGEALLGISAQSFLPAQESFALGAGASVRYSPLRAWPLSSKAQELLPDVSELTVDGAGQLYVLSQESRTLARLAIRGDCSKSNAAKDERVCVTDSWELPGKIAHPEGLVFWNGTTPLAVSDDKDTSLKTLFVLEPLR